MLHLKIKWSINWYSRFICEVIPHIKLLHDNISTTDIHLVENLKDKFVFLPLLSHAKQWVLLHCKYVNKYNITLLVAFFYILWPVYWHQIWHQHVLDIYESTGKKRKFLYSVVLKLSSKTYTCLLKWNGKSLRGALICDVITHVKLQHTNC